MPSSLTPSSPADSPGGRSRLLPTLLALSLTAFATSAGAQERGYISRPCGFDMNRNGIFGEPQDCRVCDGATTDPDFDGIDENLIYVEAGSGADTATCGSPSSPCRTIGYAWGTRANGPGDGAEDIICIAGVFTTEESIGPAASGIDGHYTVAATGSQARAWQYPRNPTMLVGWDKDGDGQYPPYDASDVAVLDGGPNGLRRPFLLGQSDIEIAHLTVKNYGGPSAQDSEIGFVKWLPGSTSKHHTYFHDIETFGINKGKPKISSTIFVNFFGGMQNWLQFKNLLAAESGGYWMRGAGPDSAPEKGPLRIENVTRTSFGCNYSQCGDGASSTGFKLWGFLSQVEILDSIWDANVNAWEPKPSGGPPGALFVDTAQCTRDWVIRNNEIIDHKQALVVQPAAADTYCSERSVTNIVFDRNLFRNTYNRWSGGHIGVNILNGPTTNRTVEDLTVSNNFFWSSTGMESMVRSDAGNDQGTNGGTVRVLNNTFHANLTSSAGAITIRRQSTFPQQNYQIKNNIFSGIGSSSEVLRVEFAPTGWQSDNNTFNAGSFRWNNSSMTLGGWRTATGSDGNSKTCQPSFVHLASGDLHLSSADTCARDSGAPLSPMVTRDIDSESRPGGCGWDIGADERPGSCSGTPSPTPGSARLSASSYSGSEGQSVTVSIQRVNGSDGAASVRVVTANGSATAGSDYTGVSQTVSWGDGDATTRTVSVQLLADLAIEGSESFTVRLESATGVSLGSPATATVTIADTTDDTSAPEPTPGVAQLSSASYSGSEGSSVTITIQRVGGSDGAASVRVVGHSGTAISGTDFAALSQTVSWSAGDASPRTVSVSLFADSVAEGQETFSVQLDQFVGVAPGAPSTATVAIDDATPPDQNPPSSSTISFEVDSATVTEGKTLRLKIVRQGSAEGRVAVRYFTVEGSATAATDFVAESAEVGWSSGSTAPQQITIGTQDDSIHEPSESFAVVLAEPTGGATLGAISSVLVTIQDNDAPPSDTTPAGVRFVAANHLVGEGDGVLEVLLERIGGSSGPASVDLTTVSGSAKADLDFVPRTETVRWGSQDNSVKSVAIEILQDAESEGTESFELRLSNPWKVAISGSATSTVTIHDDEIETQTSVEIQAEGESPAISAQSDDRLAVLWEQPGATFQASIQLFDETGAPVSDPVPLGKKDRVVREPAAAFDREDGIGLVWLEDNPVALGKLVVGRLSPADDPARGERLVIANTSANATDLRLAVDGYGRYLVTWKADGRIHFRAFDHSGTLPLASSTSAVAAHQIDVALGGEAVMVLEIARSIAFQRYDRHGTSVGALTPVTVDVPSRRPDVAVAADGRFALVWEAETGNPMTGSDIFGQLFDASGVPEGALFRVNTQAAGDQRDPRVDANAAGDFAVTWVDDVGGRVLVRFFDAAGRAASGDMVVASTDGLGEPMEPRVAVADDDDTTVVFTRQSSSGARSIYFRTFAPEMGSGGCVADGERICLGEGRFRVRAIWRDRAGVKAPGTGRALTADTGTFWFFDPSNIELVVKALDGCGVNQRRWVFAGGLTDVEVTLQVDDMLTGDSRTYFNREGRSYVPVRDPEAFVECGARGSSTLRIDELLASDPLLETWAAAAPGGCGSSTGLCLGNGRFRVEASWRQGAAGGPADSVPLTSDTGYFWFFDRDNVELVVKVLDACGVNGRFWVFGGGLTDVGVNLSVIDTWTGERRQYATASGQPFAPILDTEGLALACSAP
jgi:hypothetical protein